MESFPWARRALIHPPHTHTHRHTNKACFICLFRSQSLASHPRAPPPMLPRPSEGYRGLKKVCVFQLSTRKVGGRGKPWATVKTWNGSQSWSLRLPGPLWYFHCEDTCSHLHPSSPKHSLIASSLWVLEAEDKQAQSSLPPFLEGFQNIPYPVIGGATI